MILHEKMKKKRIYLLLKSKIFLDKNTILFDYAQKRRDSCNEINEMNQFQSHLCQYNPENR